VVAILPAAAEQKYIWLGGGG